jgi:rifampicin phosphotransferase
MYFVKSLDTLDKTDLSLAGGKGANLGALLRAGLPVPPGFCITTAGYQAFVADNHLEAELRLILDATQLDDPVSLECACDQIRARFQAGQMPPVLAAEIRQGYRWPGNPLWAVAVRSSATAEDLPDLSFAGQQDTYLNICGEEALLDAVVRCWASLWTGRAIAYRARNNIDPWNISLAVVVQQMVQSETSGVLFTADPLTGRRDQTVIEATFGLGEALVSGRVEPDRYMVETASGHILRKELGAKALIIQGKSGGGTVALERAESAQQALPDESILALTRLGQQAADCFGSPQDLEWALAGGRLYVVQSRPITSLYPLPANASAEPLEVMLSFGVWQGMLEPYSPAGRDIFSNLMVGLEELFGGRRGAGEQRLMFSAGERLFVNITGLFGSSMGRAVLEGFISSIDPISAAIVKPLRDDDRLPVTGRISPVAGFRLLCGVGPVAGNVAFNLLFPRRGRVRLQKIIDRSYEQIRARCAAAASLSELVRVIDEVSIRQISTLMPVLVAAVASGQGAPLQILTRLAVQVKQGPELVMDLTRGLPYNVTTEMDLALWQMARTIHSEASTAAYFVEMQVAGLVSAYRLGSLPPTAQAAVTRFLAHYGMRGVGEIDLGRPRWNEDPSPLFQVLKSYLQIDESMAPDVVFLRGAEKAQLAEKQLVTNMRAGRGGIFKASLARFLAGRFRQLGGLREAPKFAIIQQMGIFHQALLAAGQSLAGQGLLAAPQDIFFLHLAELKVLEHIQTLDWKALISERQAVYTRELRRKRVPRVMLSDGTTYYDAPSASAPETENTLSGSPVSAGIVEGVVRVAFDPYKVQLAPGEILVCPATDPAWTPLFLAAGGLVMEVGGMMTHGSVVAREYGIPAIVGVQRATERLKTGQMVRVDGTTGRIVILGQTP